MLDGAKVAQVGQVKPIRRLFDKAPCGSFADDAALLADRSEGQTGRATKGRNRTPAPGYRVEEGPDLAGLDQVDVAMLARSQFPSPELTLARNDNSYRLSLESTPSFHKIWRFI